MISQNVLSQTDSLSGDFILTNKSPDLKIFHFNNSCQFGFRITKNGGILYHEPSGCRESQSNFQIPAGESKIFNFVYYLVDSEGNKLSQGNYNIEAFLFDTDNKKNLSFQIK